MSGTVRAKINSRAENTGSFAKVRLLRAPQIESVIDTNVSLLEQLPGIIKLRRLFDLLHFGVFAEVEIIPLGLCMQLFRVLLISVRDTGAFGEVCKVQMNLLSQFYGRIMHRTIVPAVA